METKKPIGYLHAAIMITVALIIDVAQALLVFLLGLIPILGIFLGTAATWIISLFAMLFFFFWFKIFCGVTFTEGSMQKVLTFFGGFLLEILPLLNVLPGWTLSVILTIVINNRAITRYNKRNLERSMKSFSGPMSQPA